MTALSIVVPCFNEEACLGELHRRLTAAARKAADDDYELVLINDGSSDGSWSAMRRIAEADGHVLAINLSRNHGHQLALTAGLDLCRGDNILIIAAAPERPRSSARPRTASTAFFPERPRSKSPSTRATSV